MLANLHKISLTSIEKAPVTQPNIYSLVANLVQILLNPKEPQENLGALKNPTEP